MELRYLPVSGFWLRREDAYVAVSSLPEHKAVLHKVLVPAEA